MGLETITIYILWIKDGSVGLSLWCFWAAFDFQQTSEKLKGIVEGKTTCFFLFVFLFWGLKKVQAFLLLIFVAR